MTTTSTAGGSPKTGLVLELLGNLFEEVERRGDDSTEVISVLIEDLAAHSQLIAAALFHHSGLEPLEADELVSGIEADAVSSETQALVESIEVDGQGQLKVHHKAGLVLVRFDDDLTEPTNAGTRSFVGAVTALFSPDLPSRRMGIIAYDENQMDRRMRRALFELFLERLPGSGTNLPSVLVLLTGNQNLDLPHHCGPPPTTRYVLHGGRLDRRRSWQTSQADVRSLMVQDDARPCVIFLGAGSSVSSGLKLGDDIRDEALVRITAGDTTSSTFDLALRFHEMLEDDDRLLAGERTMTREEFVSGLTLERVLREEFHRTETGQLPETLRRFQAEEEACLDRPGLAVQALRRLLELTSRVILVTVNFDRLIEHDSDGRARTFATQHEFEDFPDYLPQYLREGGPVPLLKIHGTIEQPETIVATVDRIAQGLPTSHWNALEALTMMHDHPIPWLYVGYSMRDEDVTHFLRKPGFTEAADERWVAPLYDPYVEQFVDSSRVALWRRQEDADSLRQRSITEIADVALPDIVDVLMSSGTED
ncbi:MAG: SIR2 family protein [Actinomycetota bacterium]